MNNVDYKSLLEQAVECSVPEKTHTIKTLAFVHMIKNDSSELIYFDNMRDFFLYWEIQELYAFQPSEKPTHLFLTKRFEFDFTPESLLAELSSQREHACQLPFRNHEYKSFIEYFNKWVKDKGVDNYIFADTSRKVRIPWETYNKASL